MGAKERSGAARYDRLVRAPLITIGCDCGASTEVAYGDRWTCPECGRTWDTSQIPAADYDVLLKGVRQYRLLVLGPPLRRLASKRMRESTKSWKLRPE